MMMDSRTRQVMQTIGAIMLKHDALKISVTVNLFSTVNCMAVVIRIATEESSLTVNTKLHPSKQQLLTITVNPASAHPHRHTYRHTHTHTHTYRHSYDSFIVSATSHDNTKFAVSQVFAMSTV